MRFVKSVLFLSAFISVALATQQDVLDDLATFKNAITTLDNDLNTFPSIGGTILQAMAIYTDTIHVQSTVDATTADAKTLPIPLSEADALAILSATRDVLPIVQDALNAIAAKKPIVDALPTLPLLGSASSVTRQRLNILRASATALEDALIPTTPPDLLSDAIALRSQLDQAFADAIAAYNS